MAEKGKLLKIYLSESAWHHGQPLYHILIKKIKELGMAGATTIRGIEGYGSKHRIHSTRLVSLSEDLPIVIEVVDREDRIRTLIEELQKAAPAGLLMALLDAEIFRSCWAEENKPAE